MAKIYKNVSSTVEKPLKEKIVLAYSGGLDTSVSIKWLQEKYDAEVITLTLDLGQKEDFKEIAARSRAVGAIKHFEVDVKDEFVDGYVLPSVRANGMYEGKYPLATALGRPLIATKLVEVAEKEGATAVAHGCTGKGNDQVRIDVTVRALNPSLRVIAPVREWNMSRDQEILYARKHNIMVKPSNSIFSIDQNLWGRSIESGPLEDPNTEPPAGAFEWVTQPMDAPDTPGYIELGFVEGVPRSVDGIEKDYLSLIRHVNEFAGKHGVGIVDHIEDRIVGLKVRDIYEAPAAAIILAAHQELEKLVCTIHQNQFKAGLDRQWAYLVYAGLWWEPLRSDLDAYMEAVNAYVTGKIGLELYKGTARVVTRSSPNAVYDQSLASFAESGGLFSQTASPGFIELWTLQSRMAWRLRNGG